MYNECRCVDDEAVGGTSASKEATSGPCRCRRFKTSLWIKTFRTYVFTSSIFLPASQLSPSNPVEEHRQTYDPLIFSQVPLLAHKVLLYSVHSSMSKIAVEKLMHSMYVFKFNTSTIHERMVLLMSVHLTKCYFVSNICIHVNAYRGVDDEAV